MWGPVNKKILQGPWVFRYFVDYTIHLPGQGKMLHSWYSRDGPRQGIPPYLGSGLLQTRFRFRMPLLQSRLHCDHDVQADQAPLTVWAEYLPARRKSPESPAKETGEVWFRYKFQRNHSPCWLSFYIGCLPDVSNYPLTFRWALFTLQQPKIRQPLISQASFLQLLWNKAEIENSICECGEAFTPEITDSL